MCLKDILNFICKPGICFAVSLRLTTIPDNAKYDDTLIGQKPKRGRPPIAKKRAALFKP